MTRFWMVRHGPTHAPGMVGWSDLPADLSDTAALARLSAHLPDAPVISSDLSRAITTADALGPRPRLPHDPALREMHFGAWELRNIAQIEAESSTHIRAFWDTPGDITAPDGESWNSFSARIWTALDRLAHHTPDLIIVAHFGTIVAALQRAENLSPDAAFTHHIDNLSVTSLTLSPPQVFSINHRP